MCEMCYGELFADEYRRHRDRIDDWGFTIMTFEDESGDRGLVCTVGLTESRNHPELVIQGCRLDTSAEILYDLGYLIVRRCRIDRRVTNPYIEAGRLGTAWIDQEFLHRGLMDPWYWFYACRSDISLKALQIVLPDGACCYRHQTTQPLLGRLRKRRLPRAKEPGDERFLVRLSK